MPENQKQKENSEQRQEIKIDYDNIDVADIMDQIKRKIAAQPKKAMEPLPERVDDGPFQDPWIEPPPDEIPAKSRLKKLLLKIMKPLSPLIKLAVLPVHHELTETIKKLDVTNRKVNYLRAIMTAESFLLVDLPPRYAIFDPKNPLCPYLRDISGLQ